jgi:hypothetical protein
VASGTYVGPPQYPAENRIINGDMRIDQRNAGASGTAAGYTIDRWFFAAAQPSKLTWQRGGGPTGFGYCFNLTTSSAYTAAATETFTFQQKIEADMISDFAWGTAKAQPVTLSFWALSSVLTGTFSGSISNDTGARVYPFTYSIPTAGVWTNIVVTIPGDAAGTWVLSGNATGLYVRFDLGCGANFRGPANAWTSAANYVGVTGAQSLVATNGAAFLITGVKLEIGSVATPFNHPTMAKALADCQRYYQTIPMQFNMQAGSASQTLGQTISNLTNMRAAPTAVLVGTTYTNASGAAASNLNLGSFFIGCVATASGATVVATTIQLTAEL